MSTAGTVTATSTEGAGDMPSSVSAAAVGAPDDGPPFSEVLSLSSPDGAADLPGSPPPARHASDLPRGEDGDAHQGKSASSTPSSGTERASGGKGRRGPGSSGATDRHGANTAGSTDPPGAGSGGTGQDLSSDAAHTEDGASVIDRAQNSGAAPTTVSQPALETTGSPAPNSAVTAAAVPDASAVSEIGVGAQESSDAPTATAVVADGSAPSTLPASTANSAGTSGAGSDEGSAPSDIARFGRAPAVPIAAEARTVEIRVPLEQGAPHTEPLLHVVTGSVAAEPASALTADHAGTLEFAAASADEASELLGFPDGGMGAAIPGLDIGSLAASISRPLAQGNGDYSVQVSLHPPELGEVRALMSLQGGVLHVTLTPEHASGFEALSEAMPGLQEQLSGGGVEVHVTLGQPGDTQDGDGRGAAAAWPGAGAQSEGVTAAAPALALPSTPDGSGRIHLVL